MNRLNKVKVLAGAMAIAMVVAQAPVYAEIGPDLQARHERIVGLWDVEVAVLNCITQAPITSFNALQKYEQGGTGQVVPDGSPTALSAHMMVWNHVKNDDYQMAFKMFRFDANGNSIGWTVVRNEISMNPEADEYVGSGVAEFYNAAGTYLFSSCPQLVGTRFEG